MNPAVIRMTGLLAVLGSIETHLWPAGRGEAPRWRIGIGVGF